jgi:hypothetical protein
MVRNIIRGSARASLLGVVQKAHALVKSEQFLDGAATMLHVCSIRFQGERRLLVFAETFPVRPCPRPCAGDWRWTATGRKLARGGRRHSRPAAQKTDGVSRKPLKRLNWLTDVISPGVPFASPAVPFASRGECGGSADVRVVSRACARASERVPGVVFGHVRALAPTRPGSAVAFPRKWRKKAWELFKSHGNGKGQALAPNSGLRREGQSLVRARCIGLAITKLIRL